MSSDYIIFSFRLCVFQSIYNHISLALSFPLDDVICLRFNIPHCKERASCYFVRKRGRERDRMRKGGGGEKSVARLASRRPRSMTSPFPRRLVARFTRPSISHFCRTQDTHLSCKHLSPPFPLPSRRRPISDPSSPSLPPSSSFSRRRLTRCSHTRWMELPPDTRASRIHRTRAASPSSTTNPMVTLTDHVDARIFSPSCRSSRIHSRNSDTLGRGVNNDCSSLILLPGTNRARWNERPALFYVISNKLTFTSKTSMTWCLKNLSVLDINAIILHSSKKGTFWEFENVRAEKSSRARGGEENNRPLVAEKIVSSIR